MTELEIFAGALQHSDRSQRAAYLDEACENDAELRARIERLLGLHEIKQPIFDLMPVELLAILCEGEKLTMPADHTESSLEFFLQNHVTTSDYPGSMGRLGRYELLEMLGQGGFGLVVKAFDQSLRRVVAIKVLSPHLAATSPPRKRFLREARTAAQIRHEHVVHIYDVEEQPIPYLVMEFIEGQTLQDRLDQLGPFDAKEVVRLGRQIALGLAAAHEKGMIHRDVKPANVLIENDVEPRAKLSDFGLARTSDDASLTQSGVIAGTPNFMSPEQANGSELDARSDLFSLGSVLYNMTTGRPPFRAASALAVLKRVSEDTPRPIEQIVPEVPAELCRIIARLMEKKPAARYPTAKAVAEALEHCFDKPPFITSAFRRALIVGSVAILGLILGAWVSFSWIWPLGMTVPEKHSSSEVKPSPRPHPDTWDASVARMTPENRVSAVISELKNRNPEFDASSVTYVIDHGRVREVTIHPTHGLRDLSALRALNDLAQLNLHGLGDGPSDVTALRDLRITTFSVIDCPIVDLSPLADLPLTHLTLWMFKGGANCLHPLKGLKLNTLTCGSCEVKDLSPLRGMPLEYLCINYTPIDDLTPLQGTRLKVLVMENCRVSDLAPLKGMPLEELYLEGSPVTDLSILREFRLKKVNLTQPKDHVPLLRSISTLEQINGKPAAEVLDGSS